MLRCVSGLVLACTLALPLGAEPYRLTTGDRVIVNYDFLEDPKPTQVDLDGNIRLSEVGSIPAAGLTLDEVQTSISAQMTLRGFSGVSFVLVEVAEYSPIIVSGFVERSGQYDFLPGMDVSAALALAGGLGSGETSGQNKDVLAVSVRRRIDSSAEDIANATADIARLEAALAGPDAPITLSDEARAWVPAGQRETMAERIAAEERQLAEARQTAKMLVDSWNGDISDFEDQTVLLDQRIALKAEVIEQLIKDLADLESLRSQGLTTSARFATQQQRLADDREELLTLETAKITARRAASLAGRNRDRFLAEERASNLSALETAWATLTRAQREHSSAIEELTVLSDQPESLTASLPQLEISYTLRGPRADRLAGQDIDLSTPMLPGDILVVGVDLP